MSSLTRRLRAHFWVLFSICLLATTAGAQEPPYVPGEVIVKFTPEVTAAQAGDIFAKLGAEKIKDFPLIRASLIRLNGMTVSEAISAYVGHSLLEYIEPNYLWFIDATIPDDPSFGQLWGMNNTGQTGGTIDADIDAPEAWDLTTGSRDVIVAVIDTGVDYNHPDLAANMWVNPGEIPGNGIDDDQNGWIDDIHGCDAVNQDGDPMDDHSHGTHCSGTIGGVGNNALGVAGVNWNVRIMACKFLSAGGSGSTDDAIECLEYAVAMGATLTSNSWGGGGYSLALEDAITQSYNAGQLFVAAAGNSGQDNDLYANYPSNYTVPNVVAVGATDHNDDRVQTGLWASSYGATTVDIGAPGLDILSSVPGGGYATKSGTSMATPHVAGALALLKGAFPDITVEAAKTVLIQSADKKPQLAGLWVSEGRLNVAVMLTGPDSIPPAPVLDLAVPTTASNWVDLVWTASGDDGTAGTAAAYDLRYAEFPIDPLTFEAATRVLDLPAPQETGLTESTRVSDLASNTLYYFALKVIDEYGNRSPMSNLASTTTLDAPTIWVTPGSFTVNLDTGQLATEILTVANTGQGVLDFELTAVAATLQAAALASAAADAVAGLTFSGELVADGLAGPTLSGAEIDLLNSRLSDYESVLQTSAAASSTQVIGVGGLNAAPMLALLLADPQLSAAFQFQAVDYVSGDLTAVDGLVISEADYGITEAGAASLRAFHASGRPIFLGMDDMDDIWSGSIATDLGEVFGIANPQDAEFCTTGTVNSSHPIMQGIPSVAVGGFWCNDNDAYSLDGADWLFQDGSTGRYHGVAYVGAGRSVLMGEMLEGIWATNPQLNANALMWMMEGAGLPTFVPAFGSVAAGQAVDVEVIFDAANLCTGSYPSNILVTGNDPLNPEIVVAAEMLVTGETDIEVSKQALDFGPVFVGGASTDTLRISNPGCELLMVTSLVFDHSDFQADAATLLLDPGQRQNLIVTYGPTGVGPVTATLTLYTNDPDEPVVVIDLAGEGLVAPVLDFDPVAMTASLATGQAETQTLTIRNLGGSDLEIGLRAVDASPAGTHAPSGTSTVLNPEAAPSQGPAYAEGVIPTGEPLPPPTVALGSSLGAGLDMLFVGMDTFTEISLELLAYDEINSVDVFLAGSAVPTLADLAPYDVVVLANGSPFPDPVALGNVLADYIDQGGGVIQTLASFAGGFEVAGRFMTGGYAAFGVGYGPIGDGTLGTFDPTHPIMDGVTWAWCDVLATTPLMGGAQLVASYDIGEACIATQGEHVVGFNVFLPESYYWTGDVPLMLRNSAIWLSGQTSWLRLDPAEGIVPPGGQLQVQVTFDATELCTDTYLGEILIASNDPLAPAAVVPAEMFVQGEPDIAVSDSLIAFGEVFLGASVADTLIVSNPGCDLLVIDAISTDDPQFSVVPAALALAPEAQGLLVVTFTPTSLGAQAAVLRLESNDPDDPVIDIPLSAECVAPPVAGVSPARLAAILAPGESEIQTLTISNTGSADLVWSLRAVARDSLAGAMQAAAAEAVAGLVLQPAENSDGEQILALAPDQLETLQSRLADYRAAADQLGATGIMKLLGVTGNSRYDLLPLLLGSPELASMYLFQVVDYAVEDLTGLDGLIVAETDYAINETRALALRAFSDSGKPILLGMDDLDDVWMGTTPGLLGPIFGISDPYDADFCSGPVLNPDHPINEGLPGFNMGGSWCNDNDAYHLDAGEWLFRQTLVGNIHGVANAGQSRAVLMGENLAWIWAANPDLNANAVIWLMEGGGVPGLDPRSGVLPAGNQQEVAVTFDATNLCGGIFPSDILLESNDPLNRTLVVPAELTVTGEPDIALSDSLLDFGQVFVGATPVATLRIFNRACGLLEIASIASDDVHFAAESGPLAIPGGESYPLEVFFYAGVPGTFTGTLTMISNDPDESVITVPLRGSAVMGPEIAVDPKSFLVELAPGGSDTRTLTIENLGGTDLDWSIAVTLRDTMALALRAAAAEVVADLVPEDVVEIDGGTLPAYSSEQIALIGARLPVYQDLVEDFRLSNALPVIGVGGYYGLALLPHLLANPQLAGAFGFVQVDILTSDLTDIAGLIISELDATLSEPKAQVIRDFSDSGRPIFLGMDDLDDTWFGTVPSLLGPVFGISIPLDGDLCTNPMLNTAHPILAGISGFNLGGAWCIDNDHYLPTTADWLFADGANGYFFGVANEGLGLTVLMGENLTQIWDQNEQLNTNAVFWMMEGSGLPSADPRNGTIAPGASTPVTLTFKAPDNCGGNYLSSLLVTSNDPVNPVVDIPVEVRVPGEPNISISDTLLAFGETFVGYSRQDTVSVINNGCEVLDVTAVTIAPGAFAVDTAPFTLAVGGTHDLVVAFAPAAQGPVSGSLTLASNDGDSPTVTVALSGTGTLPPAIGVDPGSLAATVAPGETVTKLLTVSNTGDGDLYFQLRSQTSDKAAALPVDLAAPGARAADRRSLPGAISLKSASAGKSSGGTFASGPGSGDLKPAAKSAALAAEVLAESTGAELDILILGSGDLGPVRDELLAFPEIVTVDIFDTRNLIPELDDLLPYNVVILANNNPFKDPVATGNVVAAYVDLGGGVIQTEPSFIVGYNIEGRFWDEGYSAFGLGTDAMGNANLGTYLDTHPIMEGVVTVWGDLLCQVPLAPGASWVAYWDDGRLLAATQGNKVVGLNLVVTYPGHWGGAGRADDPQRRSLDPGFARLAGPAGHSRTAGSGRQRRAGGRLRPAEPA